MVTRDDLVTILRIGIHVAKVDSSFDDMEKHLLLRLARAMKISDEERATMQQDGAKLSELIGRLSSQEARELMVKAVCVVAESDGRVQDTEHSFFGKILHTAAPDLEVPPVEQWGDLITDVSGAFLSAR